MLFSTSRALLVNSACDVKGDRTTMTFAFLGALFGCMFLDRLQQKIGVYMAARVVADRTPCGCLWKEAIQIGRSYRRASDHITTSQVFGRQEGLMKSRVRSLIIIQFKA
jgi:hypothetical protein